MLNTLSTHCSLRLFDSRAGSCYSQSESGGGVRGQVRGCRYFIFIYFMWSSFGSHFLDVWTLQRPESAVVVYLQSGQHRGRTGSGQHHGCGSGHYQHGARSTAQQVHDWAFNMDSVSSSLRESVGLSLRVCLQWWVWGTWSGSDPDCEVGVLSH